jgi:DNA polymerase-3 subunit delta'
MKHGIPQQLLDAHARGLFPQTIVLEGQPGIGKKKVALELAELLRADSPLEPVRWLAPLEKIDRDPESKAIAATQKIAEKWQKNPYHIGYVSPIALISVELARNLKASLRLKAEGVRVVVVPEAHTLNEKAANAMLKTLEEAPPNTYFILTAPSKTALLKTIQSRCAPFLLHPLDGKATEAVLAEYGYTGVNTDVLGYAQGSPGAAMKALDNHFANAASRARQLAQMSLAGQVAEAFSLIATDFPREAEKKSVSLEDALFVLDLSSVLLNDCLRELAGQPPRLPGYTLVGYYNTPQQPPSRLAAQIARVDELHSRAQDRKLTADQALQDACLVLSGEVV